MISPDGVVVKVMSSPIWSAVVISLILVLFLSIWFKPKENKPRKYLRAFIYFGTIMGIFLTLHYSLVQRQFEPKNHLISEEAAESVQIKPIHEAPAAPAPPTQGQPL